MNEFQLIIQKLRSYIQKKSSRCSLILHDNGEGCVAFDLYSENTQQIFRFENINQLIEWTTQPLMEDEREKYTNKQNNRGSHKVRNRHQKYNKKYTFKHSAEPSH